VNAASRIESATKELGCDIVISETVYREAPGAFRVGDPSNLTLRGKEQSLALYPVEAMAGEDPLMLVQQSLPDILPHRREIGLRFYDLLFQRHPEYRELFPDDMEAQATSLINMMESCVVNACRPGDMESGLRELGRRHVTYGVVTAEAFDHVGACLLETLDSFLGDRFTPALKNAWATIYGMVSRGILQGIEEQLAAGDTGG
jgi:hemoglobin-like flavoprotein